MSFYQVTNIEVSIAYIIGKRPNTIVYVPHVVDATTKQYITMRVQYSDTPIME